jgi:hypothetical protein
MMWRRRLPVDVKLHRPSVESRYGRSFLIRQIPVAAWACGDELTHERSAMQHTISRRGAFRTQTLIAQRACASGENG